MVIKYIIALFRCLVVSVCISLGGIKTGIMLPDLCKASDKTSTYC